MTWDDPRTANRNYPLPAGYLSLREDVDRIIAALSAIDADIQFQREILSSDDPALDTLAELIEAIKKGATEIDALVRDKLTVEEFNRRAGQPSAVEYDYDGDGNLRASTETVAGLPRVTSYHYTAGRLDRATTEYDGHTRTENYHYDASGNLTGSAATEI